MKTSLAIGRVLGIPIIINASWLITFSAVTAILALQVYPEWISDRSAFNDRPVWHWLMALASGLAFFVSILLHELAHSVVALRYGIPVRSITLFILGGVSQISGEAKRPAHEFWLAIAGPAMSVVLSLFFFLLWAATGFTNQAPFGPVIGWLAVMNLILAVFNMAPGFPMDGGRVLRSLIWGLTGNLLRATRVATLISRGVGYALAGFGAITLMGLVGFYQNNELSSIWFVVIGLFIESSARNSWEQVQALNILSRHKAEDLMSTDLPTVESNELLSGVLGRAKPRFIFFVVDSLRNVLGVLTEREAADHKNTSQHDPTAAQLMTRTADAKVAAPDDDGATLFQTMESASVWYLPVVSGGQVCGVVSKEQLLMLLAADMGVRRGLTSPR